MNTNHETRHGYTFVNEPPQLGSFFERVNDPGRTLDGTPVNSPPPPTTPSPAVNVLQQTRQASAMPTPADFTLAIFTAKPCEFDAVEAQFDDGEGETYHGNKATSFTYKYGKIWGQNVLLIFLLDAGPVEAASSSQHLLETFEKLQLILLVGVCAGVAQPPAKANIFIGDVIIGNSVLFYGENMRWEPSRISPRDVVKNEGPHYKKVSRCLGLLGTKATRKKYLDKVRALEQAKARTSSSDRLFPSDYHHVHRTHCPSGICDQATGMVCEDARSSSCQTLGCSEQNLIARNDPGVEIHVGPIASAPLVMRSPAVRDGLARDYKVLAFEMEATGLWDAECPVVPIKGVSDFADSHKGHEAQEMAATMAACVMRHFVGEFLGPAHDYQPSNLDSSQDVTLKNVNFQPNLIIFPPSTKEHYDEDVQAPAELHDDLSNWWKSTTGENLLLWGQDRNGWLKKALDNLASMEGDKRIVHIRCEDLVCGETLSTRIFEAIFRCCRNLTPQSRQRLEEPGYDAVGRLDRLLESVLPVLIYGLDNLPGHHQDNRDAQVLRALIRAAHFKILLTASDEVSIGECLDDRTTEVDIGGWWVTQTLYL